MFAVVCLMTGTTVLEHSHSSNFEETELQTNSSNEVTVTYDEKFYTPTEVATAVTFVVAIYQVSYASLDVKCNDVSVGYFSVCSS